jgi:uncharacterized protein
MYALGEGVPKDFVLAYLWVSLTASHDDPEAQKHGNNLREAIAKGMTPAQIAEAQKMMHEWKPKSEISVDPTPEPK